MSTYFGVHRIYVIHHCDAAYDISSNDNDFYTVPDRYTAAVVLIIPRAASWMLKSRQLNRN